MILTAIEILPDKAAILTVFGNRGITDHLFIFINRIKIKDKNPTGEQVIVHQMESLKHILIHQQIIQGIADTDNGSDRTVQIQLPHILTQIQNIAPGLKLLIQGDLQHLFGAVHPNHVIALFI